MVKIIIIIIDHRAATEGDRVGD